MENTTQKLRAVEPADSAVYIHFPHERACVQILEILRPFGRVERELILGVVAANPQYPEPWMVSGTTEAQFAAAHKVARDK